MIAVVDLDGTYLRANSLHIYIRLGIRHLLRRGRWLKTARIGVILSARRLRLVSHADMKFRCAEIIGWDADLEQAMAHECSRYVNPEVQSLISLWQSEGCEIVVATAAFGFYAKCIVPYRVIGTAFHGNTTHAECRGENKAAQVKELADSRSAKLHAVITDSLDDLPLLRLPFTHRYYITPLFQTATIFSTQQ